MLEPYSACSFAPRGGVLLLATNESVRLLRFVDNGVISLIGLYHYF